MYHPSIHHYFLLAYTIFLIKIFVVFKGDKVLLCSPGCPASFKNFKHIDLLIMNMCIGVDIYIYIYIRYGVHMELWQCLQGVAPVYHVSLGD